MPAAPTKRGAVGIGQRSHVAELVGAVRGGQRRHCGGGVGAHLVAGVDEAAGQAPSSARALDMAICSEGMNGRAIRRPTSDAGSMSSEGAVRPDQRRPDEAGGELAVHHIDRAPGDRPAELHCASTAAGGPSPFTSEALASRGRVVAAAQVSDRGGGDGRNMPGSIRRQCARRTCSVAGQKPARGTARHSWRLSQERGMPNRTSSGSTSTRSDRRTSSTSLPIDHLGVKAWCCSQASRHTRNRSSGHPSGSSVRRA
jgi:hypothetical protein